MQILVPNPIPRPQARFVVWNRIKPVVCNPIRDFPLVCTILLKEGDPTDYISDRGYCSVLGIIRDKDPKIVPNPCVVKNNNIRQFSLQFLTDSLDVFKLPLLKDDGAENTAAFIKLVVFCKPYY